MAISLKRAREKRQIERLYEGIGRFAVEFERVCALMRACILGCFSQAGLREPRLAESAIARMTAGPLRDTLHAVLVESRPRDSKAHEVAAEIGKLIKDLIEERNKLIHAHWKIGADEPGLAEREALYEKLSTGGAGLLKREKRYRASDFEEKRKQAHVVQAHLLGLLAAIRTGGDVRQHVNSFVHSRVRAPGKGLRIDPDSWKLP